jgi:hypothetical protein
MARYQQIPDHPEIAHALRTGHPHNSNSVKCADCEQDFYGDETMYISDGELVCGNCMKDRLLDAHGIADLAAAFDIAGTTVSDYLTNNMEE